MERSLLWQRRYLDLLHQPGELVLQMAAGLHPSHRYWLLINATCIVGRLASSAVNTNVLLASRHEALG